MPFGIDISAIRKRIHDLLKQIERQNDLGADGGRIVTLDQQSVGRLPRIDALQQQAMARATRSRREAHRARLLAALNRLEEGEPYNPQEKAVNVLCVRRQSCWLRRRRCL